jgi:2-oxoglutarate ferredoxin oxidoreductase subunit beta
MDRDVKHMREVLLRADAHRGTSLVEIYQNCNVFNDGAFEGITAKETRSEMMIELHDGEPIRFGTDNERGVILNEFGECEIVEVADVGEERLLVHDETREDPALAFALSRLSSSPTMPTPMGVFRSIQRPTYEAEVQRQLVGAVERQGPGDLHKLIGTGATWEVN